MQNIDFYEGNATRPLSPQFDRQDMEYFSRMSKIHVTEEERNRKKASRMIFFIGALCIISFTTGIVVGLKFAGGTEREIVDDKTYNAVRDIGTRVSGLLNDKKTQTADASAYPTSEYPYVIRVEEKLTEEHAKSIATYLSNKGHTVILTQNSNKIDLYTGPYKNISQAKKSLKIIALYPSYSNTNKLKIMQRR